MIRRNFLVAVGLMVAPGLQRSNRAFAQSAPPDIPPSIPPSIPLARDLAQDAREAQAKGRALIVLYTTPGCPWCEKIKREYLRPMLRNPAEAARFIVREVDISVDTPLIDPRGTATTHRAFAQANGVRMTPVTAFIAADGSPAAEPIIGFPAGDFFGAYLDERLTQAQAHRPVR